MGAYFYQVKKQTYQERIKKIAADIECIDSFNRCAIDHVKVLLRDNKAAAV